MQIPEKLKVHGITGDGRHRFRSTKSGCLLCHETVLLSRDDPDQKEQKGKTVTPEVLDLHIRVP